MIQLQTSILLTGLGFGESPRWHQNKLWLSDMDLRKVITVEPNGKAEKIIEIAGQPSGLGWLPDGKLQVVSMTDRRLLRLNQGVLTEVADLSGIASGICNDMVVDKVGRSYIGNFGLNTDLSQRRVGPAEIIMVTPEGKAQVAAVGLVFPNGTVITPDGRELIVAETFASRLTAFDINPDGSLSGRRVWAKLEDKMFPDGICLDAEGAIWTAIAYQPEVIRIKMGGEVTHRIRLSGKAFACMLGGTDRRTLFILTVKPNSRVRTAGQLEVVNVEVPGAGLP
jgi:sugar lactone lactonase YvrE